MAEGVLVVDDQPPFRAAARMLLELDGRLSVLAEATTGEEAVLLAARLHPALVLMDVNLPGMNGIEATRMITAARPETLVVLVSTRRLADLPPGAGSCGAATFVRKEDLEPDLLVRLVAGEAVLG